jgi:SPP1 gp7 family putative phage head morphogenesis protein
VNRARQTELGVKQYTWRTSLDERVRPEHQEREGEVFSWAKPPKDGHPGQPINCRCTADPDLSAILDDLE